ncbi:hypothetical protein [Thalassospira alkalitolerans]|uniref:hypothetical protein n=1 Tax=Thalassospira alkalitolerans TaxID=1293890 RepID=UPI003AA82A21
MLKNGVAILAVAVMAMLGGCETTVDQAKDSFTRNVKYWGDNPLIEAPFLKELEKRIQTIAIASNSSDPPWNVQFNPQNQTILDNFKTEFDQPSVMRDINLARAGFDATVAAHYPEIGAETGCDITDKNGYFVNDEDDPKRFDWQFIKGTCEDGIAHGIGEAHEPQTGARFVGRFDRGYMIEGVFTVVLKSGKTVINIGGVPNENRIARLLSFEQNPNGYQSIRFADFDNQGRFNGFGLNIWGYTNMMLVRAVGRFKDSNLTGFGAEQVLKPIGEYGATVWNSWIGMYENNKLNGLGAWTNNISTIRLGEWVDGGLNGVIYSHYVEVGSDYFQFSVGRYVKGRREGPFKVMPDYLYHDNQFETRVYANDERIDEQDSGFDFGQVFALAAGSALIGSSSIADVQKLEIGGAFAADVLGNTGGTNMGAVQQNYQMQLQNNQSQNAAPALSAGTAVGAGAGGGLQSYAATIKCDSGTTSQINVPYRTESCRVAAVDFATTYACNKLDQERVIRNCQSACGHPQCLEQ